MLLMTDHVIADGLSFLLLIALLAFLWFRPWRRRRADQVFDKVRPNPQQGNAPAVRKKAA